MSVIVSFDSSLEVVSHHSVDEVLSMDIVDDANDWEFELLQMYMGGDCAHQVPFGCEHPTWREAAKSVSEMIARVR